MSEETKKIIEKSDAAFREEKVLEFWKDNKIFNKTLEASAGKKEFIFYDGPPTANGMPGIHHLIPQSFKDAIPRYKTMREFHVRRKGGWDTHGLPVELLVEKELGLKSKKEIESYGIAAFNQKCKESVWKHVDVWYKYRDRVGYWVDKDNPYVTYHNEFIESLWSVVKKINERGLLYKDYKVVPWCPRCGTALSSHELAQGYEDVKDLSVTAKFKVVGQNNTYILAWTTTPWTLPGNVALAVGENIDYVKVKVGAELYILAKARLSIITESYEIVEEIKGGGLIGLEYEPLFPYFKNTISENEKPKLEKAFRVHKANFVTTEDGTGVVHTAVMYGQDDFVLGNEVGLPKHHMVGLDGKFLPGTGIFERRFVKDEEVAVDIIKDLAGRGLLFKKEKYEHSYPHCWRCKTPLIYYARDSWYIKMSDPKIKAELISQNKEINWEPAHTRDGRFGEWLREIKDWAISRERYWGTPLPVWSCETCKKTEVLGSIEDIKSKAKKSGNKYLVMRHGGTNANKKGLVSYKNEASDHLTEEGKRQVTASAEKLSSQKIDLIVASPFVRTKETALIVKDKFGLGEDQVVFDSRLAEFDPGDFDGKEWKDYHRYIASSGSGWFNQTIPGGESLKDVGERTASLLYEIENKFSGKNILIVTHGGPAWLLFVNSGLFIPGGEAYRIPNGESFVKEFQQLRNAEVRELPFAPLPHNEKYELDLHKPYIDEVKMVCSCGGELIRTKEVMDVWFDSGAMPFAQDHYPFENKKWVEGPGFPADFIAEAIDQTRGWFYTLHAVGILMGRGKAYKNVICLGHLLDAKGKKMSKSLGNVVNPWEVMDKYGVDTLRLWMYSINQPGESKNFDEKTVALLSQQVFGLLYNVLAFYELYRDKSYEDNSRPSSKNILDKWILTRLFELRNDVTANMDSYKLLEPVRGMRDFIGDLSTWYLRRSRERIKEGDSEAKATLYFVLKSLAKLMAPFAPFAAEDIWLKLRTDKDKESVHLENWPTESNILGILMRLPGQMRTLVYMDEVRKIVTLGLEARQKTGIKVRQPLASIKVKFGKLGAEYLELIKEELNVKEIIFDDSISEEVLLDIRIDEELKAEGSYRELVRALQDMRKKSGLTPSDVIALTIATNEDGKALIEKFQADMKKTVLVSNIEFAENDGEKIVVDELVFRVKIEK
ncbi:MAG: class I tRNA ligase family protein [Minisyncoccia bacterium]